MQWQATVYTNDPETPVETIGLEGSLKTPVMFWPSIVFFKGPKKQSVTQGVRIEGKLEKPFKVEPGEFDLAKHVAYEIVEIEAGRVYQVNFTSIPGEASNYRGSLKLKTSYAEKPEIVIPIWANLGY